MKNFLFGRTSLSLPSYRRDVLPASDGANFSLAPPKKEHYMETRIETLLLQVENENLIRRAGFMN